MSVTSSRRSSEEHVDHQLALTRVPLDVDVGLRNGVEAEPARVQHRPQQPGIGESGRLPQDRAVVLAAAASEHRKETEHARVGGSAERQGRERVGAPSERADDVDDALVPQQSDLPESVRNLARLNAHDVSRANVEDNSRTIAVTIKRMLELWPQVASRGFGTNVRAKDPLSS